MKKRKNDIISILSREDISGSLSDILSMPAKSVLSPLFSALLNPDELVRWHAITVMGLVVSKLADEDIEQGRIVMRRLMWSLNDESGGIGWGAPECMGEIMAEHWELSREFHSILFSYLVERDDGADNFLEYLPLRKGAFWALARLISERPDLGMTAYDNALKALKSEDDPFILLCLCLYFKEAGKDPEELSAKIKSVKDVEVDFYWDRKLSTVRLGDMCSTA
ncbi:MAG: HEAT repeat domain-containing protein [Desulfovibrionales bacterium]|nr:HEAT repeat domain-containing protein [Desulfovibrionales bacterium]